MDDKAGEDSFSYSGNTQASDSMQLQNTQQSAPQQQTVESQSPAAPTPEPKPSSQPVEIDASPENSTPKHSDTTLGNQSLVQWSASEFIDHQKSAGWFLLLIISAIVFSALVYLITNNFLSTLVVIMASIAFAVFAGRKPRTLTYTLTPNAIQVGSQQYRYDDFKTFSVIEEGALYSIFLEPVKRFALPLTIYFAHSDGEKIFDVLAQHLPHEDRGPDMVDRMMRKIRF